MSKMQTQKMLRGTVTPDLTLIQMKLDDDVTLGHPVLCAHFREPLVQWYPLKLLKLNLGHN